MSFDIFIDENNGRYMIQGALDSTGDISISRSPNAKHYILHNVTYYEISSPHAVRGAFELQDGDVITAPNGENFIFRLPRGFGNEESF